MSWRRGVCRSIMSKKLGPIDAEYLGRSIVARCQAISETGLAAASCPSVAVLCDR
jgi:hypothetical protein